MSALDDLAKKCMDGEANVIEATLWAGRPYMGEFMAERAAAEYAALVAERDRLRELLKKSEWEAFDDWGRQCWSCLAYKKFGHNSDCELAAALGKAEG